MLGELAMLDILHMRQEPRKRAIVQAMYTWEKVVKCRKWPKLHLAKEIDGSRDTLVAL